MNAMTLTSYIKIWFSIFLDIGEEYIPRKTVVIRPKNKPWMSSGVRKALGKRNTEIT